MGLDQEMEVFVVQPQCRDQDISTPLKVYSTIKDQPNLDLVKGMKELEVRTVRDLGSTLSMIETLALLQLIQ